jgi:hypothetical protein
MSGENQECGRCGLDVSAGIHVRPEDCIRALRSKLSTADACGVCGRCHAAPTMRCWTERDIERREGEATTTDLTRECDDRARIVAWLRNDMCTLSGEHDDSGDAIADAIERGEYLCNLHCSWCGLSSHDGACASNAREGG